MIVVARATGWRSRFSLEYRRTVTTRAGKRFVVSASPRCLAGASARAFLPWPAVLGWIVIRQFDL
ncbi:MAG: hypothetical protein JWQ77_986, partial [Jatrophihabitans sp.]|nr:hypothetical protein [Jatrophihabitans sp.]